MIPKETRCCNSVSKEMQPSTLCGWSALCGLVEHGEPRVTDETPTNMFRKAELAASRHYLRLQRLNLARLTWQTRPGRLLISHHNPCLFYCAIAALDAPPAWVLANGQRSNAGKLGKLHPAHYRASELDNDNAGTARLKLVSARDLATARENNQYPFSASHTPCICPPKLSCFGCGVCIHCTFLLHPLMTVRANEAA